MRKLVLVIAAGAALAVSGSALAVVHDVQMGDNFFSPADLTVAVGDTIRWTHVGEFPHTSDQTTAEDGCDSLPGGFSSGMMMNGDVFEWVPEAMGSVWYKCAYHCPMMTGTIMVEESTPVESTLLGTVKSLYR